METYDYYCNACKKTTPHKLNGDCLECILKYVPPIATDNTYTQPPKENSSHSFTSQPSEKKPHKESKFTLSAAIENLDKLSSIGKSLLPEQKPSEGNLIQETDGKCKEILTKWLNTGFDLDIALPQAMQEYAQSERLKARNEAIQECIDIYKMNEWYDTILEKFEKLKSKTI